MKIALVGCPKVGKTRFARKMKAESSEVEWNIIDNIPQKFSKRTGILVGPASDYRVNFVLAAKRFEEEHSQTGSFISTTTLLDSIVYSTIGIQLNELDRSDDLPTLFASNYYFTSIYLIKYFTYEWNFDETFYFPYKGNDELYSQIDALYRTTMEAHGVQFETIN